MSSHNMFSWKNKKNNFLDTPFNWRYDVFCSMASMKHNSRKCGVGHVPPE